MNIVDDVDGESPLQEKGDQGISINNILKHNAEEDSLHNKTTDCINLQNDKTTQGNLENDVIVKDTELHNDTDMKYKGLNDDTLKSSSLQNEEVVKDNNLQNKETLKDCNANDAHLQCSNLQNDEPEINNVEINGVNHTKNGKKEDIKNDDNRKITIVLNSKKGYEIKNDNKYIDTDTCLNDDKDDSIYEETTGDSITDKSDNEDEDEENQENEGEDQGEENEAEEDGGKENEQSEDGDDGEDKKKRETKYVEIPEDEQSEDGELAIEEESDGEDEESEKEANDEEDEEIPSNDMAKTNMVNGIENDMNVIDADDDGDEDDEEEDDIEKEEKGININYENEEITAEFDNKYEGKTSQLPNFAVVYSFINMFGALMDLPNISLPDLEQSIDTKELGGKDEPGLLELLHVKMFRKLSKSSRISAMANCTPDRLNKSILKLCQFADLDFARDFQQHGYHILTSDQKLMILKHLCEVQFDENAKFRNDFQELYKADQSVLRLCPFGYEQDGSNVWLHEDTECNVHVYAGEDGDPDGNTWRVRAGCLEDMSMYISKLKLQTEINPKDIASNKIKERQIAREEERQRKKADREQRRKEADEKRAQKKGRSRRKSRGKKHNQEEIPASPIPISDTSEEEEDDGCVHCYENKQADVVLLCDGCDAAYHTLCLRPPVMDIPDDDWFCPFCLQVQLVQKLELKVIELKNKLKKKERKAKRLDFYGIRTDNIVEQPTDGRRLGRAAARRVDYNFTDYDQLISEAVYNYGKKIPVNPRMEDEDKGSEENGSNYDGIDKENSKTRRNVTAPVQKRKLTVLSSDEYEESEGSEYVYSSSEEVKYNNMKSFIVNDDIDEVEERYSRNKRLRRSGRTRNNPRSCRKTRRRYEEDSDFGDDSDKSSNEGRPQRRLRERKVDNLQNLLMYAEQFSDEEDIVVKDVDDGGEWDIKNEAETVGEELESEELSSNAESEAENKVQLPTRQLSVRVKKKRYVLSDDDTDEEVPCADESEEENNNKIEIEDNTADEQEEDEVHEVDDPNIESESDNDQVIQEDTIENYEELEDETEQKLIDDDMEGRNTEKEINALTESFVSQLDDELMRKIKEEEEMSGINLKDEGILKSGILPPCFSSSLPQNDHSSPPSDSPPPLDEISPDPTNIFRSSENEYSRFKADEFWEELNDSNREIELPENLRKDSTQRKSSEFVDETNVIKISVDNLQNKDSLTDKLPKENTSKDVLQNENSSGDNLQNFSRNEGQLLRNNSNKQALPRDSNSTNTESLHADPRSLNSDREESPKRVSPITSTSPVDNNFNRQSGASAYPISSSSSDLVKQSLDASKNTAFHRPVPSSEIAESKTTDVKPNISEMQSAFRVSMSPSTFYARPPPPYHPPEYSPRGPSRMPTPPIGHTGPLHPQHRLRAMAAALCQSRPPFEPIHHQSVPRGPPRQPSLPPAARNQQPLLHAARRMQSTTVGPRQQQSPPIGPHHQQGPPPDHRQKQSPPVGPRPQQSPSAETRHQQPSIQLAANNHPAGRLPLPAHSAASLSLPIHPAMRLPSHPSSRLRPPTSVSSSRQQTPVPMRPTPNYAYNAGQPGMRALPPNWHGTRDRYEYYQQFHRPQAVPSSQYYGGQSNWPPNQPPSDWNRLQELEEKQSGENVNTEENTQEGSTPPRDPTSSTKSQSKEYKEHMKQLKEHAKQEKELKRLQKQREKEIKKQKRSYSPHGTQPTNAVGNMAYFKNMVIGGDNSGMENNANAASSYPPFKSSRM